MNHDYQRIVIKAPLSVIYQENQLRKAIAQKAKISPQQWFDYHIRRRSIDARKKRIMAEVSVDVFTDRTAWQSHAFQAIKVPALKEITTIPVSTVSTGVQPLNEISYSHDQKSSPRLLIIGAGPAGLFAALRALSLGIKPVIIERGKSVRNRRKDLAILNRKGIVNPDSNYCFGEGGAGTFSDGKLYTRAKKRGKIHNVLQLLVDHGAPPQILYEAHPHIGSNRLPAVIQSIRDLIIQQGGEVHFDSKLVDLIQKDGKLIGARLSDGREMIADAGMVLATGHSARDIFDLLHRLTLTLTAKPFAMGLRVEHPQSLIDTIQYHGTRPDYIGSASYRLVTQVADRGTFSFCMCPGGIIAPAASEPGEIVVNGWSPYERNGKFANSGIVVSIEAPDFQPWHKQWGALAGVQLQKSIEQKAFQMAGSQALVAPAQRLTDFIQQKTSHDLPDCSYIPGVTSCDLNQVLPSYIADSLRQAFQHFGQRLPGYLTTEAIVVGVESRTSSPVRIPRDPHTLSHPQLEGLFPCGEGAGYAGGIISAALDGIRCTEAACNQLQMIVSQDAWA